MLRTHTASVNMPYSSFLRSLEKAEIQPNLELNDHVSYCFDHEAVTMALQQVTSFDPDPYRSQPDG